MRWALVLAPVVVACAAAVFLSFHPDSGAGPRPPATEILQSAVIVALAMTIANIYEAIVASWSERRR